MKHKIILKDAYKGYTLDQDKILTPEETVRRFKEKLKAANLDILEETIRIDNGRLDIPVYFSVCGPDAEEIIGTKKQMGKGGTPQQAEASAVMELAERFSFFSFCKNEKNFFVEQYKNIKDRALPFEAIAKSVHDDSSDLEKAWEIFSGLPLKWTWAYNMTKDEEILIPFNWFFAINEYNGPSAGNCVEEAVLQGICELVERHTSSIISQNRLNAPGIDLDSSSDALVQEMIKKYKKLGVQLYATDFSLDTGIPTVGVMAYDPSTFPEKSEIIWTAGTTPDPQKAFSRALTEVAQLAGDFNTASNYVASGLPKFNDISQADYIIQDKNMVGISSLPNLSNNNIKIEVENCISALSNINMDVILINVMHPQLEVPAFYSIIPGAHFRERAAGTSVGMFSAKLISENENPEWAFNELSKMDRLMPDKYYIKFFQGLSRLSINEPLKAFKYLEKSLELEPKEEDVSSIFSYMGVCLKELELYSEAIEVLEKGKKYDNERTDIHNLMGFCNFMLKNHEQAIECFKEVLKLNPTSAIDYANIASNYREMGDKENAINNYRIALELDPTIEFARDNLKRLKKQ